MTAKKKHHYISVAGVMGSGKTTVCKLLADKLHFHRLEERVNENLFLPLFYKNAKRWALPTQLFYLKAKTEQLAEVKKLLETTSVVQDAPIYQDHFTYAQAQKILGHLTEKEYGLYETFFQTLHRDHPAPDLIIQLDASLPVLEQRIRERNRGYERKIDMKYVKLLSKLQNEWVRNHSHLNILNVSTNALDLSKNKAHQKKFVETIKKEVALL